MKQITLDFEIYEEELMDARIDGMVEGKIAAYEEALEYLYRPHDDIEMNNFVRNLDENLSQVGIAKKRFLQALLRQKSEM